MVVSPGAESPLLRRGCGSASGTATRRAGRRRSTSTRRRSCTSCPTPCAPRQATLCADHPTLHSFMPFSIVSCIEEGLVLRQCSAQAQDDAPWLQVISRRHASVTQHSSSEGLLNGSAHIRVGLQGLACADRAPGAQVCLYTCGDLIASVPFFEDAEEGFTTSVVTLLRPAVLPLSTIPLVSLACFSAHYLTVTK